MVNETDEQVELCVIVRVPEDQNIGDVTFNLAVETQNGTASMSKILELIKFWVEISEQQYHCSRVCYLVYQWLQWMCNTHTCLHIHYTIHSGLWHCWLWDDGLWYDRFWC